jgi:hypothetical protein
MSNEQWYIVCDEDGNSVSIGTVVADPLPDGLFSIALSDSDAELLNSGLGIWDANSRSIIVIPTPVPTSISARQIRLWLIQHGIQLDQIDNAIQQIQDDMVRQTVKIEWEYAPYVERSHPWLIPLAQSLGLNEEQIDQAFREASII